MTRTSWENLLEFDLEIDKTFHILQRVQRVLCRSFVYNSSNLVSDMILNNNITNRELAAPDVTYQSLCIQYPELEVDIELRSGIIYLLSKFHGLVGEDPNRDLQEFHMVCSIMKS